MTESKSLSVPRKIKRQSVENYLGLIERLHGYDNEEIESGIMYYCLKKYGCNASEYHNLSSISIYNILQEHNFSPDIENVINFFESLLTDYVVCSEGAVFTPKYISDYIASSIFGCELSICNNNLKIIDPSCGCGIFLISTIDYLHVNYKMSIIDVINKNLYGIEINPDNCRRCKLILKLYVSKNGFNYKLINPNIICSDSLKINWCDLFGVKSFDYIIGNPPYVNPHDLNPKTSEFLKENFTTTKDGVFNIFYAFIEYSFNFMNSRSKLSFIVPNNFLTIKTSRSLRRFLQEKKCVRSIIDFGENQVFYPVMTYSCIIELSGNTEDSIDYYVMPNVSDIQETLQKITKNVMPASNLSVDGWNLVDDTVFRNISKIESFKISIKKYIATGIATLRDNIFLVNHDNDGYYKVCNGIRYSLENGLIKPIYKVPDIKNFKTITEAERYIIFPYVVDGGKYVPISEAILMRDYPKIYEYLLTQKEELNQRDGGKGSAYGWYTYARTQGLNKFGRKLLFSTFSSKPNFIYIENKEALFCNGYAVFENEDYDLKILLKILNSRVMDYYVSNTSYQIAGGFYCYQKKFVEKFTIPPLSNEELKYIEESSQSDVDSFLWSKYKLE